MDGQTDPPETLGQWLQERRASRGLSQQELAAVHGGVHQTAISSWERGRTDISRNDFVRLCEVLDVPETEWPAAMRLPVQSDSETSSVHEDQAA